MYVQTKLNQTSWAALESNSLLSWNFGSKKSFRAKRILGPKIFGSKQILGSKKFWVQKIFGSKKLWVQKNLSLQNILSQKFLVPPSYGIGLSMVGWISRGGSDGGSIPWL